MLKFSRETNTCAFPLTADCCDKVIAIGEKYWLEDFGNHEGPYEVIYCDECVQEWKERLKRIEEYEKNTPH